MFKDRGWGKKQNKATSWFLFSKLKVFDELIKLILKHE